MHRTVLLATTMLVVAAPALAQTSDNGAKATGQDSPIANPAEAAAASRDAGDIVVTARKREETLRDVPVAATALTGALLENRGIQSVREAAVLAPGLNITSDGAGRAFVSIRGVGVTLVSTVQPGVGLFIDGIYQPNTSYLNNPLLDVERIEVLRGPQGTLYGKNTLGGAINVITRQPGNDLEVRGTASYAGPDNSWLVSGSVSGPIVEDKLQVRVAASHREQNGFLHNIVIGGDANPLNTDSINATIRAVPTETITLTVNGYYDWVDGVNTPYARVSGPTDYSRDVQFNSLNRVEYRYRGVSARLEADLGASKASLIGSYDARDGNVPDADGDFGPGNFVRSVDYDRLRTKTVEARLDSTWSPSLTSLVGVFYSNEATRAQDVSTIFGAFTGLPFNIVRTTQSNTNADTYAAFGTVFFKPSTEWELAVGLRYDHEDRTANGSVVTVVGPLPPSGGAIPQARIKSDQVEPRVTLTYHWDRDLMTYASIARGYRGGGFNAPTAPTRTYTGDSAWTYELGSKFASADRRVSGSVAAFYSDYKNYIGLNSIAPAAGGGLVTVDLNSGNVASYGIEVEGFVKPTRQWTISGGATLMHARLTDSSEYTQTTGRLLASDRLTFQPDFTGNLYSDYAIPLGGGDTLTLTAGVTAKGSRLAATLNQTTPTILKGYTLANAAITYRRGPLELALFANNIFNKHYFESYIEKTTLQLAGLPASDLGIIGDLRRYGVRASIKF